MGRRHVKRQKWEEDTLKDKLRHFKRQTKTL